MTMPAEELLDQIALIAPGTALRDGLDRIVNGRTGGLVVMGDNESLREISTGGFTIDAPFTPTALRELAKMDGAILLNHDLSRIASASVHLMPTARLETDETGTRHRTADRVSRQTGLPVVTVSASMGTITLFSRGRRRAIQRPEHLLTRANQAVQALSRYRARLDEAVDRLSALEVQDQVTVRDLSLVAQRFEMMRRLVSEVEASVVELGTDGRLLSMQLRDLMADVDDTRALVQRDYGGSPDASVLDVLHALSPDDILDLAIVARALDLGNGADLDAPLRALGYRQLSEIPRVPPRVVERLIDHFGSMHELFGVTTTELLAVDGVNFRLARNVREGLVRMAENVYEK